MTALFSASLASFAAIQFLMESVAGKVKTDFRVNSRFGNGPYAVKIDLLLQLLSMALYDGMDYYTAVAPLTLSRFQE